MPNWAEVLEEINQARQNDPAGQDVVRRKYLSQLAAYTGRTTIAYYSGWLQRRVVGSDINDEDKNGFMLCAHEVQKDAGLDIILHTPGGGIAATESIIHYLKTLFGSDIRAIIPQISMSAGTIIACACKSIVLGKQSNLGPTDPQIQGIPAFATKREFQRAYQEILDDQRASAVWGHILRQLHPTFLQQCDYAIGWTRSFVRQCLKDNMFSGDPDAAKQVNRIVRKLMDLDTNKGHSKHLHFQECIDVGLNVEMMEDDPDLQDLILTTHHCYMHTLANTNAFKIIENHLGRAFIKQQGRQQSALTIGLGGPPS